MSGIIYQITLVLNLMFGGNNHQQQAQQIYSQNDYKIVCGVVIIDTDEL
ncbi:MAG: hypothetical protein IPO83_18460 [Chitinophagaceae bacterium]|nr:hypothetical protein [Chitinophagaceae bacterium]